MHINAYQRHCSGNQRRMGYLKPARWTSRPRRPRPQPPRPKLQKLRPRRRRLRRGWCGVRQRHPDPDGSCQSRRRRRIFLQHYGVIVVYFVESFLDEKKLGESDVCRTNLSILNEFLIALGITFAYILQSFCMFQQFWLRWVAQTAGVSSWGMFFGEIFCLPGWYCSSNWSSTCGFSGAINS